jgi:integrase
MAIQRRRTLDGRTRYLAKVFRGRDQQGKRLEVFQTFSTLAEARMWERQQKRSFDLGRFIEPSQISLSEYIRTWLEATARLQVRERTLEGYTRLLDRYVFQSSIASVPLTKLTTMALEQLYADLSSKPLSARTVRLVHSVLHVALAKAARDRRIASNPATGALLPRQQPREMQALDRTQLARLLATSEAIGNRWTALWVLLAHGGLRPSEALGLKWADVGTDRLRVNQVLVTGLKGGGWSLTEPKTHGSRRIVTLPSMAIQALSWHRTKQEAERIAAGSRYRTADFVFAGQLGQPLDLKNTTARHFRPLLAEAGLPRIRVYDLRHTHATLMLSAGVPVKVVSERLGHASAVMTLNVYAHVLSGQQEDAVTRLEAYMTAG